MTSISTSTLAHPATPSPADISIPTTSTSATSHTYTTSATTNSTTPDEINLPPTTNPDPTNSNNVSTVLAPPISALPTTDNSSATSHHLTSPAPSVCDGPGQDGDLQTSPEERSSVEPEITGTADEEDEMVQKNKQGEMDESRKGDDDDDDDDDDDGGKEAENEKEKSPLVNSAVARKEEQEDNMKADDNTARKETGLDKARSNKEGELCGNEGVIEDEKQEGTKSVDEK
ncbi:uncharacterized protein LOC144539604 [Centroberyx gerrardi]